MPTLPYVRRRSPRPIRVVVLGDLLLDIAVVPGRPLVAGTDVGGRVSLRQGGSAATTARWLARLGVRTALITAVGRDAPGRALIQALRDDEVKVRAVRPAGRRTGRIAVIVGPGGERSFVADRGVADELAPRDLRPTWFAGADLLHLPIYSLVNEPLSSAGRRAIELARTAGAIVSVDLASSLPLLAEGRHVARERVLAVGADILLATLAEAHALLGGAPIERLLELAAIVVVKRGAKGATVLARPSGPGAERLRFEVATRPIETADTTGAGDAFDAGFLATWLTARRDRSAPGSALHRSVLAGHRAAARQLTTPRQELSFG